MGGIGFVQPKDKSYIPKVNHLEMSKQFMSEKKEILVMIRSNIN